jgi:hypothetical protein
MRKRGQGIHLWVAMRYPFDSFATATSLRAGCARLWGLIYGRIEHRVIEAL